MSRPDHSNKLLRVSYKHTFPLLIFQATLINVVEIAVGARILNIDEIEMTNWNFSIPKIVYVLMTLLFIDDKQ